MRGPAGTARRVAALRGLAAAARRVAALRGLAAAALAGAALAVAPGSAAASPEWRDAGVAIPDTVDLHAVAALPGPVIAVGTERETGEVVVFRRVRGEWQRDLPLPPPPPFEPEPVIDPKTGKPKTDPKTGEPVMTEPPPEPPKTFGELVDVALTTAGAWAIGSAPDEDGGERPLILKLRSDGWEEVTAPDAMGLPRTIAMNGDDGLVGDADGQIFEVTDGVFATTPLDPAGVVPPTATPVNGLALTGAEQGIAVAPPADQSSGFLSVDAAADEVRQDVAESMPAGLVPVAVGAGGGQTVAVDGGGACRETEPQVAAPALWSYDTSLDVWRRTVPSSSAGGTRWCDLALTGTTLLVAGDRSTATGRTGAIWRREGTGQLRLDSDLDDRALHGIAVGSADEAWAVGEEGALWRRAEWPEPPPPPPPVDDGDDGSDPGTGDGGGGETTTTEEPAPPVESPAPAPAPEHIVVPLPPAPKPTDRTPARRPKPTSSAKPAQRLLVGLQARRVGKRLVLSFRLRRRARVVVTALRGAKVLARVRSRPLRAGRRRLVVRFRGSKPPTQLKITVRPVGGPGVNKEGKGS